MNYCLEPPLEGVEVEQFSKNYKVSITYRETLNGQDINKEIPINELENYVNYTALKINKVSDSSDYFYRYLKFDIIEPVGYTFTDELRITESAINTVYGDKVNGYVVRFTANISEDITSQRSKANDIYFNGTGLTGTELTIYQGYLERLRQTLIPYISKFSGDGLSETDLRTLYTDSHYNQKAAGVVDYSEFKYFAYSYVYGIYTFYDEKRKYNITKKNMLKDNRTLIPVLLDQIVIYDETTETYTYYPGDPSEEKKAEIWGNLYRLVGGNNLTINITTLPEYEPERYYCSELYNKQYLKLDGNRFTIQMSSTVPSASYLIKYDDNYENCDKVYVISNSRNIYLKPGSIQALYDLIKEGLPTKDYIASFNNLELIMLQDDREKLCTALEIEYSNVFITWVKYDYTENVDWKNAYIPYKLKKPEENNVFDKDYNEMLDEIDYHFSFDKHLSAWCGWKEPVYLNVDDYPPFDKNSCNIYISEVTSTGYKYGYYKKYKNMNGVENKKGVSINTITITTDAGEPPEIPENLQNMTQEDKDEWIGKYKQWIYNVNIKLNQRISSILPLMVMSIKVPITDLSATPFLYTQWYIDFYPASEIDKIVDYFLLEYDSTQWILNNLNVIKAICGTNKKNYDPGDHLKINNGIDVSRLKVGFNYDLAVYLPYIRREDMTAHKGETPNYIYFNGEEGLQNGEGRRNQLYQPLEGESESTGLVGRVSYFTNYLNNLRTSDDSNFNGNDYPENVTEVLNSLRELKPGRTGLYIYEDPLVIKNVNEGQNCHELVYDNNEQCYKFTYNSETYKVCYVPTQGVLYMIDKYPTSITTGEIKYLYNGYGSSTYVKFLRNDIGTIYNGFLSTGTLELTNQEIETLEKVKESYTRLSLLDNLDESNEEEYVKNFLKNTFAFYRTYDEEFCSYLGETSVSNMNTEIFNGSNFLESNSTITTSNGSYVYNLLYFDNNDKHVSALEVKLQIVTDARNSISTFILPDDVSNLTDDEKTACKDAYIEWLQSVNSFLMDNNNTILSILNNVTSSENIKVPLADNTNVNITYYAQDKYLNTELMKLFNNIDYRSSYKSLDTSDTNTFGICSYDGYVTNWILENYTKLQTIYGNEPVPTRGHLTSDGKSRLVVQYGNPQITHDKIYDDDNQEFYPEIEINGTSESVYGVNKNTERRNRWGNFSKETKRRINKHSYITETTPGNGFLGEYEKFSNYLNGLTLDDEPDNPEPEHVEITTLEGFEPDTNATYFINKGLTITNYPKITDEYEITEIDNEDLIFDNDGTYYVNYILTQMIYLIKDVESVTPDVAKYLYRLKFSSTNVKFLKDDVSNIYKDVLGYTNDVNNPLSLTNQGIDEKREINNYDYHGIKEMFENISNAKGQDWVNRFRNILICSRTFDSKFCSNLIYMLSYDTTDAVFNGSNFSDTNTIVYENGKYINNIFYYSGFYNYVKMELLDITDLTKVLESDNEEDNYKAPADDKITLESYESWLSKINNLLKEINTTLKDQIDDMIKTETGTVEINNKDVSYTIYAQDKYLNTEILKLIKNIDYSDNFDSIDLNEAMGIYAIDYYATKWILDHRAELEVIYGEGEIPTMGHLMYNADENRYDSILEITYGDPDLSSNAIYNGTDFYPAFGEDTAYGVNNGAKRRDRWITTYIQGHAQYRRRTKKDEVYAGLV